MFSILARFLCAVSGCVRVSWLTVLYSPIPCIWGILNMQPWGRHEKSRWICYSHQKVHKLQTPPAKTNRQLKQLNRCLPQLCRWQALVLFVEPFRNPRGLVCLYLWPTMFDHVLLMVWSFFIMCIDVWVCFNYMCSRTCFLLVAVGAGCCRCSTSCEVAKLEIYQTPTATKICRQPQGMT